MKKVLLEMKDMSDSKEVYASRPNPFVPLFIYCILGLLMAALFYSFFGEIEEVAEAFCVIRPNESVSTVASPRSGKVIKVYYTSGKEVKKGELLCKLESANEEAKRSLLINQKEGIDKEIKMTDRFIKGIVSGKNPFSSDVKKEEYTFYIKYKNFELTMLSTEKNNKYEKKKNKLNIEIAKVKINELNRKLTGLFKYRNSVKTDKNMTNGIDEYSNMYRLYEAEVASMADEYKNGKEKIELDNTKKGTLYNLKYFKNQAKEYSKLIKAIEDEDEPEDEESISGILYKDYIANINEYRLNYLSAEETYDFYKSGGSGGNKSIDATAHTENLLEGYNIYKESVLKGKDLFDSFSNSIFYRDLYKKYKDKYDSLAQFAEIKKGEYLIKKYEPNSTDFGIEIYEMNEAADKRDRFKEETLATINDKILQIKENIASKEINMGKPSLEYNEAMAKIKMDSTENEEEAYRVKVLAEYKKTFTELKNKVKEYELLESSSKSKKELLKDLKENYDDTKLKLYFQTLSKIDDLEKNYNRELATIKSDLSLYDILYDMSENNVDKDGKDLVVSKLLAEKLSELLSDKEALNKQKEELKAQIKLIDEDISKTEIKAEKEGIINKTMDFTEGDLLQEGQLLATIIPKEEGEFKTEIYIKNSDIAGIGEGASIKYIIEALPKEKFGIINGNVIKISKDVIVRDGQFAGYFKVEGSIDADKIFDEKGNKGKITVGMQATAKILRENKTIFNYIMEKVNIF